MHVGDQAVQEQNGANINPRANVRRLELFCPRNRHSLSYLRCRHLIPATSLTPTSPTPPSVINRQPLWLPHDKFVLALK